MRLKIQNVNRIAEQEVHLPENARPAELVLILQIGAVAPLEHQYLNEILSLVQVCGKVKFTGHVADLAVPHEPAVDKQVEAGVHAFKIEVDGLAQPGGGQGDGAAVQSAGVGVRHKGGIHRHGIQHIDILRRVVIPIQVGLPGARHLDSVGSSGDKARGGNIGHVAQGGVKGKVPIPAQGQKVVAGGTVSAQRRRLAVKGDKVRAGGFAPDVQGVGVLVIVDFMDEVEHTCFASFRYVGRARVYTLI